MTGNRSGASAPAERFGLQVSTLASEIRGPGLHMWTDYM